MKLLSLVAAACVVVFASVSEAKSVQMRAPSEMACMQSCQMEMRQCVDTMMNNGADRRSAMETCNQNMRMCGNNCRSMPIQPPPGPACMQQCQMQMRDCMGAAMSSTSMNDMAARRNAMDMCKGNMDSCGDNCRNMPMQSAPEPACAQQCHMQMRDCMSAAKSLAGDMPMNRDSQRNVVMLCSQKVESCRKNCM